MLARKLKGVPCLVNLIPFNYIIPTEENFQRPSEGRVRAFRDILERFRLAVTQRQERGHAIDAACGQLRGKHRGRSLPLKLAQPPIQSLTR